MTTAIEMVEPRAVALCSTSSVRVARLALLGTPSARMLPVVRQGRVIGVLYADDVAASDVGQDERILSYVRPVGNWVAPETDWSEVCSMLTNADADLLVGDADHFCGQLTPAGVLRTMPAPNRQAATPVIAAPTPVESTDRDMVLVVEDDEMVRSLQMLIVEEAGLRPIGAATLEDARTVLETSAGELALILLDVHLPDGNGVDFCAQVTNGVWHAACTVPIVIVSASGDPEVLADALYAGSIGHFRKPFQPLDLLRAVRAHASALAHAC